MRSHKLGNVQHWWEVAMLGTLALVSCGGDGDGATASDASQTGSTTTTSAGGSMGTGVSGATDGNASGATDGNASSATDGNGVSGGTGGTDSTGGSGGSGGSGASGAAGAAAGNGAGGEAGAAGTGCMVGGVTYPNGASMPDPYSCNQCTCAQGEVGACTKIGCPVECPDDTAPGSDCASCGPVDECLVVHIGCLPSCETSDDCIGTSGFMCHDGVCRNLCG